MSNHETIGSSQQQIWDMSGVPFAGEKPVSNVVRSIEELREHVTDMTTAREGALSPEFESGTYLFHSATVEDVKSIFESGEILNAGEIYERKRAAVREKMMADGRSEEEIEKALDGMSIRRNTGQEGISWSVNGIDAMPGTRGRIAGFVAAPESILGDDKLVIPSRPAPYELLQVSSNVNTKELFETKKQREVWGCGNSPFGEMATVDSGLMQFSMNIEYSDLFQDSCLKKFGERGGLPADELRAHFKIMDDNHITIDEDLFQQKFDEDYLPPAAVFIQAMIDRGDFNNSALEGKNVVEILDECKKDLNNLWFILGHARKEGNRYVDAYVAELDKAKKVSARVEDMYFVTGHKDLGEWLEIIRKTGHLPRGILLYDDEKVVKENFASDEKGDHDELSEEIGRIVGVDREFWCKKIGLDVENIPRAGTKEQVLKDSAVSHDTEVRVVGGKLRVMKI